MAEAPPITVYMPAYNVGKYVRQAVESILTQTFVDFEFIIIDDGSTDDTLPILQELAAGDKRIRLLSRPNVGVAATANQAVSLARGEFLARIDGDDVAMPTRLEKQLAYLREDRHCVVVGSKVLLIDEAGLPLFEMPHVQIGHDRIESALWSSGWSIVQPACTFRREAVIAAGCYRTDRSLHEDHDLFLRMAEIGRLENLPEVLQWYRQRLTSLTFTESGSSRRVLASILEEARRRRGLPEARGNAPTQSVTPNPTPLAALQRCKHWAWMSLKARHVPTARKYAFATVKLAPFSPDSWKLMYCALRGR